MIESCFFYFIFFRLSLISSFVFQDLISCDDVAGSQLMFCINVTVNKRQF